MRFKVAFPAVRSVLGRVERRAMPPARNGGPLIDVVRPMVAALCMGLLTAGSAYADGQVPVQRGADGRVVVPEGSPVDRRLTVSPVTVSHWNRGTTAPGVIVAEPARNVTVFSPAAGKVLDVAVRVGEHVDVGDEIAHILSADAAQASADELKAQAALDLASRTLRRAQGVLAAGGEAVKDVENAKSGYAQAQAEEQRARTHLESLSTSVNAGGVITLRSPIEGAVGSVNTTAGMNVVDMTQPLAVVTNIAEVWAVASVPERDIRNVELGQAVNLTLPAFPGQIFHSTVSGIEPIMQADTQVLMVRVILPNVDRKLHPNMYANMTVMASQPETISVPQSALVMNNDQVTVFVETAPHVFERRAVQVIYDDGALCRITSGLAPGDRIVTTGAVLLNDD
ncbi:efflux RND transporter periplasmic adaptor subunit [Acetobacter sp.]|uniref:efflux RND transporter periplasmic adaptor subunit n=1 Tax=Acetobacter sp. TaxID=440 RepID=UPI0025C5ACB6|nr:efflux RND transporter periplasmic adaptor subunit [Acetobacter sp.]MCH4089703.1 efflux RND transporter periplasmic adaptor subunit [Acetobacter sp.]MCI1298399.1 efflux RND transporter periplasmic adaptor subunit [Acetobacter sp.]MCI1316354.1 efflux RND transporter periplasmic adaptor subunit [Acetobacter sp.]